MIAAVLAWVIKRPWILAIIALGVWGAAGRIQAAVATRARDSAVATLNSERTAHAAALAAAQTAAAAERARILSTQQEALNDANQRTKRAQQQRAQASASLADAERLLHDAIDRVSGGPDAGHPAAGSDGETARRLGSLLDACAARHRELALDADAALDASRIAGQACEQSYDALTNKPTAPSIGTPHDP